LFARLPEHGTVKSRLAADLSAGAAFELYRWLLRVQARVMNTKPAGAHRTSDYVFYAPGISALRARLKFYPDLAKFSLRFRPQCEGDLGVRLADACTQVLEHHDLVLLWGADIPTLPPGIFDQAAALYPQSVITLARDGGYAFLSLAAKNYSPAVFRNNIRWSTLHAGADQLRALKTAGIQTVVSGKVADLDRAKDFTRILRELELYERTADLADLKVTLNRLTEQ
jgi:glycosyltransferase A (GT-A) superfamily protein (DUF2064 family)